MTVAEKAEITDLLKQSFLLKDTDFVPIDGFFDGCVSEEFACGEEIFGKSHFSRSLILLLSGKARVRGGGALLKTLARGDIFGAASLFGGDEEEYPTEIVAAAKTKALFIPQAEVCALLGSNPGAALNYIAFLSEKVRFLNKKIDSFTSDNSLQRLAKYLLSEPSDSFRLKISLSKLSETLSIGRATLYRSFDYLENEGIISRDDKSIVINSRGELSKLARQENKKE